jgi:hypothetical protein
MCGFAAILNIERRSARSTTLVTRASLPLVSARVPRVGDDVSLSQTFLPSVLGSAGCQPAVAGSLRSPDKTASVRHRKSEPDWRSRGTRYPELTRRAHRSLRAFFERIRSASQKCEGFAGEMEGAGDQDTLARSLRSQDRFGNG